MKSRATADRAISQFDVSRSYLMIEDSYVGWITGFSGGGAVGQITRTTAAPLPYVKKSVSGVRYDDLVFRCPMPTAPALQKWIEEALAGNGMIRSGSVVFADLQNQPVRVLDFSEALMTEIAFPTLDGASKDAGYLTLRLTPSRTDLRKPEGVAPPPTSRLPKPWRTSNFRLSIDGFAGTDRVSKVEGLTIKTATRAETPGKVKIPAAVRTRIDFPELKVTFSEIDAAAWLEWHRDFVILGNGDDEKERSGSLSLLSPDLKKESMRIDFSNMGIVSVDLFRDAQADDRLKRMTAVLYFESMQFQVTL